MESAGAQILKQVVDASEIEQVNTGNEWEFRYKNNAIFTVYTVKQEVPFYDVVFCVYYIRTEKIVILVTVSFQIFPKINGKIFLYIPTWGSGYEVF